MYRESGWQVKTDWIILVIDVPEFLIIRVMIRSFLDVRLRDASSHLHYQDMRTHLKKMNIQDGRTNSRSRILALFNFSCGLS